MDEREWLTERFEQHRPHLRAVAYRMLGSVSEADDALQEAWLRIRDQDRGTVENMQAWLTTVVGRACLNMLRSRRARREELPGTRVPDPVVTLSDTVDPEQEALLADSVGLALLVVLDALGPAERLAFVLHDAFGVPFADIATALDRSEAAAQQLASRARRRLRNAPEPDRDLARQRSVVDTFFAGATRTTVLCDGLHRLGRQDHRDRRARRPRASRAARTRPSRRVVRSRTATLPLRRRASAAGASRVAIRSR